jgi:LmbE family N-acetylglucosaminyl deacetylase
MEPLDLAVGDRPLRVICLGAHADDLEIGCGGTLLDLLRSRPVEITWAVASAAGERASEARRSATALLRGARQHTLHLGTLPDGGFPSHWTEVKRFVTALRDAAPPPDVVFTHRLEDRHQDHRLLGEIAWQTWRDAVLLEMEIPKWEGDLAPPNVFVPVSVAAARRKVAHLLRHFGSQHGHDWFREQTFMGLMQLRAVEARAASGYAEAFHARKLRVFA